MFDLLVRRRNGPRVGGCCFFTFTSSGSLPLSFPAGIVSPFVRHRTKGETDVTIRSVRGQCGAMYSLQPHQAAGLSALREGRVRTARRVNSRTSDAHTRRGRRYATVNLGSDRYCFVWSTPCPGPCPEIRRRLLCKLSDASAGSCGFAISAERQANPMAASDLVARRHPAATHLI